MKRKTISLIIFLLLQTSFALAAQGINFANNASSLVANVGGISDIATSVTVTTGEGALFPVITAPQYFMVTLVDASGNREIVKVTARTADVLTIVRARE